MGALKLRVPVTSSGLVVREDVLCGTLGMVPDGVERVLFESALS